MVPDKFVGDGNNGQEKKKRKFNNSDCKFGGINQIQIEYFQQGKGEEKGKAKYETVGTAKVK